MRELYIVLFYILGMIMGSFYSLVAYRSCNKISIIKPRSHCEKCKKELRWYEMIPVFSYIFLKGRCSDCNNKISIFYPVSELLCGLLFALSYYLFGFSYDLLMALCLSSLFIITVSTDLNYYIIPDMINFIFGVLVFVINIFRFGFVGSLLYLLYGFIMFIFMYLLMLLGNFLFKEESLGGGDIKLLFVLGMVFPLLLSFIGITLAAFIALPLSIIIYIKNKDKAIPFGPFLVGAFLIIFVTKIDVGFIYQVLNYLV